MQNESSQDKPLQPQSQQTDNQSSSSISSPVKKGMPLWLIVSLIVLTLLVLSVITYFSIKYVISKVGANQSNRHESEQLYYGDSSDLNSDSNKLSINKALSVATLYLEQLSSSNYSKAYDYLDPEFALANKDDWMRSNSEAGYGVSSYSLSENEYSLIEIPQGVNKDKKIYNIASGSNIVRRTGFSNNLTTPLGSQLSVSWDIKNNKYSIIDHASIIKKLDINKSVVNIATNNKDKLIAKFNLKKAYFSRNNAYFLWDYSDSDNIDTGFMGSALNYNISTYTDPVLINLATGNSVKHLSSKVNSEDLFTTSRSKGIASNNSYDAFSLQDGGISDLSMVWNFTNLKLKYTSLFSKNSTPIFPGIEFSF